MTTSIKNPGTSTPELAPVIDLDDIRAVKHYEIKTGRKVTPDNWMGTVSVEGINMLNSAKRMEAVMTKRQKWAAGLMVAALVAVGPVKDMVGPKIADHLRSVNEPVLSVSEVNAIPEEYHEQVDGRYAIGVNEVMAKADLDIEDPKIREAVENHIEAQITSNNPNFIDTVDAESYLEEQSKNNG